MSRVPANTGTRVFEGTLHIVRRNRRKVAADAPDAPPSSMTRPLRVARLLALGHQIQRLVDAGEAPSAVADRLGFSRARVSQLMDLTLLAPDIQAWLLAAENDGGPDSITERDMRRVVRHWAWAGQRVEFERLACPQFQTTRG